MDKEEKALLEDIRKTYLEMVDDMSNLERYTRRLERRIEKLERK